MAVSARCYRPRPPAMFPEPKDCLALSSTFLAAGVGVAVVVVSLAARLPLRRLITRQRALRHDGHAKFEEVDVFLRFDMLDPLR